MTADHGDQGVDLNKIDFTRLIDLLEDLVGLILQYDEYVQVPDLDRIKAHDYCLDAWIAAKDVRAELSRLNLLDSSLYGLSRIYTSIRILQKVLPGLTPRSCPDLGHPKGEEFAYGQSIVRDLGLIVSGLRQASTQPESANSADKQKYFPGGIPDDQEVIEYVVLLNEYPDKKCIELAREVTKEPETKGSYPLAICLRDKVRQQRRRKKVSYPDRKQ